MEWLRMREKSALELIVFGSETYHLPDAVDNKLIFWESFSMALSADPSSMGWFFDFGSPENSGGKSVDKIPIFLEIKA